MGNVFGHKRIPILQLLAPVKLYMVNAKSKREVATTKLFMVVVVIEVHDVQSHPGALADRHTYVNSQRCDHATSAHLRTDHVHVARACCKNTFDVTIHHLSLSKLRDLPQLWHAFF